MRVYLIDPALRRITDIELNDRRLLDDMRRIIGCEYLDHMTISDRHDQLWSDDGVFTRGEPCFAFKIRNDRRKVNMGPFGGKCIIVGRAGDETVAPSFPIEIIENDCDWLDEIVPQVIWTEYETQIAPGIKGKRFTSTIVYSRAQR